MHLSDYTFLNIENDPSTSQEVVGPYLSEEIWGKVSLFIQNFGLSLDLPILSLSLSLSLSFI